MIDVAWIGRPESRIFRRTEAKNESTFWFQHAASFAEMIKDYIAVKNK